MKGQNMVITILEAYVEQERWSTLKSAFEAATQSLPPSIAHTFLIQNTNDKTLWRIMTIWHNREALDEYRRSVETPGGVLMFRAAGAEPSLSIFDMLAQATG